MALPCGSGLILGVDAIGSENVVVSHLCYKDFSLYFGFTPSTETNIPNSNGPFAASGHMVHAGGQAAHWDIQNKENSNLS